MRAIQLSVLLSIVLVWAAFAPPAGAQSSTVNCKNALFSAAVLERFPRVREACLDVLSRDTPPHPSPVKMPGTAGFIGCLGFLAVSLLGLAAVFQQWSRW